VPLLTERVVLNTLAARDPFTRHDPNPAVTVAQLLHKGCYGEAPLPSLRAERRVGMTDRSSTGDRLEGGIDKAKGKVKQGVGDLTGDDQTKGEGMLDEAKGSGKQAWGDLKDAAGDLKDNVERSTR
jgi:uncharacterized protein YjbJ (UPF0337 family)